MKVHLDTNDASGLPNETISAVIEYLVKYHRDAVRGALEAADEREWMAGVLALNLDVDASRRAELEL